MDDIKRMLNNLISVTENDHRAELYNNLYGDLLNMTSETENDTISRMYRNLSGLMAHSELSKREYVILKEFLQESGAYEDQNL